MKLSDWLRKENITQKEFVSLADKSGVIFSTHAIAKWCQGQEYPDVKKWNVSTKLPTQQFSRMIFITCNKFCLSTKWVQDVFTSYYKS